MSEMYSPATSSASPPKSGPDLLFWFAAFFSYLALACLWLWPLPMGLTRYLVSYSNPGDALHSIWSAWWWRHAGDYGETFSFCPFIAYPFGVDIGRSPAQPLLEIPFRLGSLLAGEVTSYNLLLLLSFPLSGCATALVVRAVTGDRWAAWAAGAIFAFSPYRSAHVPQLGLMMTHWLPLVLFAFLKLSHSASTSRWTLLLAFFLALTALTNYYYGYVAAVMLGAFLLLWPSARWKGVLLAGGLGCLLVAVSWLGAPHALAQVVACSRGFPIKDLFVFSGKPWDYLIASSHHPWLGRWTGPFIHRHLYGSNITEQTLYVGWIPIMASVWVAQRAWKGTLPLEWRRPVFAFTGLALVAAWWAAPPFLPLGSFEFVDHEIIARWKIPFPSYALRHLVPMFRVYARFGIAVMLALGVLTGIAIALIRRSARGLSRHLLPVVILGATLWEFGTTFELFDGEKIPKVYAWLARLPESSIVAEYPLRELVYSKTYEYLFFQRLHHQPLVNGSPVGTAAELLRQRIRDIRDPTVPLILREMGVRYIVVHPFAYHWEEDQVPDRLWILGETFPFFSRRSAEHLAPPTRDANPSLRLIRDFGNAWVYECFP